MRDIKVVRDFFEKESLSWEQEHGPESERRDGFRAVYSVLRGIVESFPQPPKVLDIGCGTGAHLRLLSPLLRSGVGVDVAEGMVDQASYLAHSQLGPNLNLSFVQADAGMADSIAKVGSIASDFDMIMIVGAFEHILAREELLRALHEIRNPACKLVILSLSKYSLPFMIERVKNQGEPPRLCPSDRHFSLGHLKSITKQCGWLYQYALPVVAPPSHQANGPGKLIYQIDRLRAKSPVVRFLGTYCAIFTPESTKP
jgi:SAM-dependent methyltransferase